MWCSQCGTLWKSSLCWACDARSEDEGDERNVGEDRAASATDGIPSPVGLFWERSCTGRAYQRSQMLSRSWRARGTPLKSQPPELDELSALIAFCIAGQCFYGHPSPLAQTRAVSAAASQMQLCCQVPQRGQEMCASSQDGTVLGCDHHELIFWPSCLLCIIHIYSHPLASCGF